MDLGDEKGNQTRMGSASDSEGMGMSFEWDRDGIRLGWLSHRNGVRIPFE